MEKENIKNIIVATIASLASMMAINFTCSFNKPNPDMIKELVGPNTTTTTIVGNATIDSQ